MKTVKGYIYNYFHPIHGDIFTFNVCCPYDCLVVLCPTPDLRHQPIYEIVIGGWVNTQSVIRIYGKTEINYVTFLEKGIVHANEMRGFWITWKDNFIKVGRKGENDPFMTYHDENLAPIKYASVRTATEATWLIDGKLSDTSF